MDMRHEYSDEGIRYLYEKEAYVFNISRERFDTQNLIQNRIEDEVFGESVEQVDLFAVGDEGFVDIFSVLSKDDFFNEATDSGSGYYVVGDILSAYDREKKSDYVGILVVSNIISTYLPDKKPGAVNCEFYYFTDNELDRFFNLYPSVHGFFAKERLRVDTLNNMIVLIEDLHNEGILSDYQYSIYNDYIGKFDEGSK